MAEKNGRDPNELRTVLRVYPVKGGGVGECAGTLRLAERDTEVEHAFVDLRCVVPSSRTSVRLLGMHSAGESPMAMSTLRAHASAALLPPY